MLRWLGCIVWGLAACLLPICAQADVVALNQAQAVITVKDRSTLTEVSLPYHWDRQHAGLPGSGVFEIAYPLAGEPSVPYAAYFVRLGNAYEIWLNGTLLQRQGSLQDFNSSDYAKAPHYVEIPPQLLQAENLFRIHIRADGGRRAGVPALLVGPDTELRELYREEHRWRVDGSLAVVVLTLLVALISLALWLTQYELSHDRPLQRDNLYLFGALAEFFWALRVGDALIETPPLPWQIWGVLMVLALAGWVCCLVAFCVHVAGWTQQRWTQTLTRLLWLLFGAGAVCASWSLTSHWPLPLTVWYGLLAILVVPFGLYFSWSGLRTGSRLHLAVALAVLFNAAVGLRDWMVFRLSDSFGGNTLTRYSSVLFGLTLGFIVVTRFRTVSAQARDLMVTLAQRVQQREQELAATYQKVEELARQQERTQERARILRDMHDGVGSHISAAIRQMESGRASREQVLVTLRDSLDQLKLSIDSMNLPPGDVTALLANLRYRLEPRFAALDIELQWAVDLIDPIDRLDASAMRHLQFMLFEALSNVLQHARASVLRLEAAAQASSVVLRVVDNGRGFDVSQPLRKGLASMTDRAQAIGARLEFASEPGRTVVSIVLS